MKTYEQKYEELKKMNEMLSDADLPLAELVEIYEKAQRLLSELKEELEASRLTVEKISENIKGEQ